MTPELSLMQLHTDFSQTKWGKTLAVSTRFGPFCEQSQLSEPEWWHLLGADVNTLKHLKLTYGLTRWFCQKNNVNEHDTYLLSLAAIIHDWAESIVGDIPAPKKNGSHEEREQKELHGIIDTFCTQYPMYETLREDMHTVTDAVIFTQQTALGKAFRAIELMGYCRTMSISWSRAQNTAKLAASALRDLATNVRRYSYPKLEAMAPEFPAVQAFLDEPFHKTNIKAIQALVSSP